MYYLDSELGENQSTVVIIIVLAESELGLGF